MQFLQRFHGCNLIWLTDGRQKLDTICAQMMGNNNDRSILLFFASIPPGPCSVESWITHTDCFEMDLYCKENNFFPVNCFQYYFYIIFISEDD